MLGGDSISSNKQSVMCLGISSIPCCSVSFDIFSNIKYNKNALDSGRFGRPDGNEEEEEEEEAVVNPRCNKLRAKEVGSTVCSGNELSDLMGTSKDPRKVNPAFGSSVASGEDDDNVLSKGEIFLGGSPYDGVFLANLSKEKLECEWRGECCGMCDDSGDREGEGGGIIAERVGVGVGVGVGVVVGVGVGGVSRSSGVTNLLRCNTVRISCSRL